jgi:hypothetical protein
MRRRIKLRSKKERVRQIEKALVRSFLRPQWPLAATTDALVYQSQLHGKFLESLNEVAQQMEG